MAASGYTDVAVTSHDTLRFRWWDAGQSITGNYTNVSWALELHTDAYGRISSTASKSWSVNVNGAAYSGTNTVGIGNNSSKVLASGTTTIYHNSDGTKTFSYSFSQYFGITFSGSSIGTISGSGTGTLNTIPRKSTLSVSNGTLGVAMPLKVTRQSTSFTHTVKYTCGNYSGTICEKSTETNLSFTPPMDFAFGAPNGSQVYVSFTIETFNGSKSIGSNPYAVWCDIPATVVPTFIYDIEEDEGYLARFGSYIQGKSKLRITINPSGIYGSTIKSCTTSFDGKTYTEPSFTTDAIVGKDELDLIITVTDSRERTASTSIKLRVLAYNPPKITSLTIKRTDANGVSSSNGAYLTAIFDAQITKLDENVSVGYKQNEAVYKAKYVNKGDSSDANETTFLLDEYDVQGGTYTFPANPSSSYEFTLIVDDFFTPQTNTPTTKTVVGGTARKTFSVFRRGLGFAFGKIAELEDFLEVNFKTFFHKFVVFKNMVSLMMENANGEYRDVMHMTATDNLKIGYDGYDKAEGSTDICGNDINFMFKNGMRINGVQQKDFIVEEGESDGWFYRKWNSGIAECWKIYWQNDVNAAEKNYSGFYYSNTISVPFPFVFTNLPTVTVDGGSVDYINFVRVFGQYNDAASFVVVGLSNITSTDITVDIRAIGRWK